MSVSDRWRPQFCACSGTGVARMRASTMECQLTAPTAVYAQWPAGGTSPSPNSRGSQTAARASCRSISSWHLDNSTAVHRVEVATHLCPPRVGLQGRWLLKLSQAVREYGINMNRDKSGDNRQAKLEVLSQFTKATYPLGAQCSNPQVFEIGQ